MSNCIALIGYRGTGKSTAARLLALRLGWDWVDADVEVELRAGKSIAAMFADEGEAAFRDLETLVAAELCQRERTIVALGGGAVLRAETREQVAKCLATIWLKAPAETLAGRIYGDPTTIERRPNLTNAGGRNEISELLAVRTPIYAECATLEVDTENKTPEQVVEEIVSVLGL